MRCKSKTTRAVKKVLRLSDLDHAKRTVLNTLGSAASTSSLVVRINSVQRQFHVP